jgi:DNA polymerase
MVTKVSIDFETFSECDLKASGAWRYAQHESTEALCLAYAFDGQEPEIWKAGDAPPVKLFEAIKAGALVYAWNASFEVAIWQYVCEPVLGWDPLPIDQVRDSMAIAASFSFPQKLEDAAKALNAVDQKDAKGKRLLRKFSQPVKGKRVLPKDDPIGFAELLEYCKQDVRTERAIVWALPRPSLSYFEQRVWLLNLKSTMRGIRVDLPAIRHIIGLAQRHDEKLEKRCEQLTGSRSSQRQEMLSWCAAEGAPLPDYTADTIVTALDGDLPPRVREALSIRRSLSKTSVTKFTKMLDCAGNDGRIRGMVVYHGAATGRFAGRLVQLQNLPRGNLKKAHTLAAFVPALSAEDFEFLAGDPMEAFSSLVRSMLLPSIGYQLYVADFANIEGRVLAWMSGQEDLVAQFAANDDVYKHMAAVIYGTTYAKVTDDQRQVGKQAVLGCGYGMGWKKFQDTCFEKAGIVISDELAKQTIEAYRTKNGYIKQMWYSVEQAAVSAIKAPGATYQSSMCAFRVEGQFLYARLPSGRCIAYFQPQLSPKLTPFGHEAAEITYMGKHPATGHWARVGTYGGRLTENIVQAVARDLLVHGMLVTDEHGYAGLTTVHDELISEAPIDYGSVQEFEKLMADLPQWAAGCPVRAEGWSGPRYRKG